MDKIKAYTKYIYLAVIALAIIAMLVMVLQFRAERKNAADEASSLISITEMKEKQLKEPEAKVTVETQIIQDGLNDMGFLITQEYYFTQVEKYTKEVKLFYLLPSESEILYSYDGAVYAGVDFTKIEIEKDEEAKTLTVKIPPSEIHDVSIDKSTFKVYSEKDHLWNKMQLSDYNASLLEYEKAAEKKAKENGILDRADEQAEKLVLNFIRNIPDTSEFKVSIE
jgi:cbb3-type cytochrome oxidase subunit 3